MNNSEKVLAVIIPTTRGIKAVPTIHSALLQAGFKKIYLVITGKSTSDSYFVDKCRREISGNLFFVKSADKEKILPGEARNDGLNFVDQELSETDYILFLDDDIIIPNNYGEKLRDFLEEQNICAVMGRLVSYPNTFWSKIIDYSNFWWLQLKNNTPDLGWLGTGATLLPRFHIKRVRFKEDAAVNEDVMFFSEISKLNQKTLGICAEVDCEHHHNRSSLFLLISYQFTNGKNGPIFHYKEGLNLIKGLKNIVSLYCTATSKNAEYLKKHQLLKCGVFFSFVIFEMGIQFGSLKNKLKAKKTRN